MHLVLVGALAPDADITPEASGKQITEDIAGTRFAFACRRAEAASRPRSLVDGRPHDPARTGTR